MADHQQIFAQVQPQQIGHFIDGHFVNPDGETTFATIDPATDQRLVELPEASAATVDSAVRAAQQALQGPWGRTSPAERSQWIHRIADCLQSRLLEFAQLESLDTGKPLSETKNGDIPRAVANLRYFAELIVDPDSATAQQPIHRTNHDGSEHISWREPIGVVGLITPWNLPLYLATWKIGPALAAGNTIVLKPAELTPLTATALAAICQEVNLPQGVFNVVHGFGANSAGEALVAHPDVKAISFTGETVTGSAIMKTAAPALKKLSFELGGKGASVVFADANLDRALPHVARAAYRNQGQICLAGSRLIVERSVANDVIDRLQEQIAKIRIGDPLDEGTTMGALVARQHRDKVASYVEYARNTAGHEIICGGNIPSGFGQGAYFEPTIITVADPQSRLIQEEIFGPVLTVQSFSSTDEALELLNGTPYGLSCSVWSESQSTLDQVTRGARMGLVWQNSWFLRHLGTPFGGMKRSGIGREGGQHSLDFYSEWKTMARPAPRKDS